ncbi:MAG: T9SS type A sorting domain-containing protein [Bacteroidetes bacterium]|nr:T9SS type A sorting domain-containing protein [Bacteroidota bacterium]
MRKQLLLLAGMLLAASAGFAQVISDFESDANGFADNGWGSGFTSVSRVADPSGNSSGVLQLSFAGGGSGVKGAIQKDNVEVNDAQAFTFWVWLPTGTPDSLDLKLWAQDDQNWSWNEKLYTTTGIPRDKWYPISFFMEQQFLNTGGSFNHHGNKLGKMGIEVANWNVSDKNWAGNIYIDNLSLVGVEPSVFADFEEGTDGYADNGWGTGLGSVTKVADPSGNSAGVLAVNYKSNDKGVIQVDNIVSKGNNLLVYWIWLPADTPDSIQFGLWAQDDSHWSWTEQLVYAYQIKKEVWFPIYYDLAAQKAKDANFDHENAKLGKTGVQIANWDESDKSWNGTFYFDNVGFAGIETGDKFVVADFEAIAGGAQNFIMASWSTVGTTIKRVNDPSDRSEGVLEIGTDFSKVTSDKKVYVAREGLSIYSIEAQKTATAISIDVWVPADAPLGGQIGFVVTGDAVGWSWNETPFLINDTTIVRGKWSTMKIDLTALVDSAVFDTTKNGNFGFQFRYGDDVNWVGAIYYDNLTLYDIPKPVGAVVSPAIQGSVQVSTAPGSAFEYVRLDWVDNTLGTETYNVYVSESPIADINDPAVQNIARGIPHGSQVWAHRPWSTNGDTKSLYYAVTAFDGSAETEVTSESKFGPVEIETSKTLKVTYDTTFAAKFSLDGLDDEFVDYKEYQLTPESANGGQSAGWTPESIDISYKVTFVIDKEYLYISADVTDDDLVRAPQTTQAWQGDALEFYFGFYDVNGLKELHGKSSPKTAGDWRIGFTSRATTALDGGDDAVVPGLEAAVFEKFSGDGYIIEGRIELAKFAPAEGGIEVKPGMVMPLRIDGNDMDPSFGDDARTLMAQFGGWDYFSQNEIISLDEHWKRPATFGLIEVVGEGGVGVDDVATSPTRFDLMQNYPNPFNPATRIMFSLARTSDVSLKIYDVTGREVTSFVKTGVAAGNHVYEFNGNGLTSGVYFARIEAGSFSKTIKMMLLK